MMSAGTFLILAAALLVVLLLVRPSLVEQRGGKILAFCAFLILPAATLALGVGSHLEQAKTTQFCLSCHEMEPYGKSLLVDGGEFLPASHFQNRRIPRDEACYSCHTDYTMYGDVTAKLRGLRHLYVHYLGTVPAELALYDPYQNRECLHCHSGARSFEDSELHGDLMEELRAGETSCLECHDQVHDIAHLGEQTLWTSEVLP